MSSPKLRVLDPEEAARLGLAPAKPPAAQPGKVRPLSPEEARALGLPDVQPAPGIQLGDFQRAPGTVSAGRAAVLGGGQGLTAGYADEIGAGIVSTHADKPVRLGVQFKPEKGDTVEQLQIKLEAIERQMANGNPMAYEPLRDRLRDELARAQKEHPVAYGAGEVLGAGVSSLLPGAAPGNLAKMGAGQRLMRLGASGAATGAVNGMGSTNEATAEGIAREGLKGAAYGLGGSALGFAAGKESPTLLRAAGQNLQKRGVDNARQVLLNGADSLSRRQTSDAAVREALNSKAIGYLGTTEKAYGKLSALTEQQGKVYGEILDTLERNGVRGPDARKLADQFVSMAADEFGNSGRNKAVTNKLLGEGMNVEALAGRDGKLGLKQAENVKRALQDEARNEYGKAGGVSRVGDAKMTSARLLKEGVEDAIEQAGVERGGIVGEVAETFKPVKGRLGRLIEARNASERGLQKVQGRSNPAIPGAFEIAGAMASGQPGVLLAAPLRSVAKNRLPAFMAQAEYDLGAGANALARRAMRSDRVRTGIGAGGALERALDAYNSTEPPGPGMSVADEETEMRRQALIQALMEEGAR